MNNIPRKRRFPRTPIRVLKQCYLADTHGPHPWGRLLSDEPHPYRCAGFRVHHSMTVTLPTTWSREDVEDFLDPADYPDWYLNG